MANHKNKANNEETGGEGIPTASFGGGATGPGEQIGPYKLLRILGEGGYGIVYLAERQRPVKRRVALKVIKPGMDTKQVIARFEAERQALALLNHPNIAHVFNAGTTKAGRPYFAMEYVKGVPITEHCDRHKLTIEERLKLFLSVCEAVQHAHQKAIIHRDIKPSNILVAFEGEQAIPMIIDFGVAKALSQSLTERTLVTEQAQMVGTPEYMSPEQAEMTSQDIDTRTDVYSLGVLLYELLTGTLPFDSQTLREGGPERMRRLIREQDPKIPSVRFSTVEREKSVNLAGLRRTDSRTLERRLHGELDWITLKAMDKDRTRRYQTAYALAEDIQRYLNQEPVLAGPPSTIYKFRKFAARNKGVFFSAATIAVVVVLAAIISIILAITATEAKKAETQQRQKAETLAKQQEEDLYFNYIKLAHQELKANRPVHALDYLNKCPEQLRNWKWNYLYRNSLSEETPALVFDVNVLSFDVNLDGSKLAALCSDGKLLARDLVTGHESPPYQVRKNLAQLDDDYYDAWMMEWVVFCPDGKRLAVVGDDYAVKIISLRSHEIVQSYPGHTNTVSQIAWHPDGVWFATLSEDNTIRLWNRSQEHAVKVLTPQLKPSNMTFTGGGKYLIVCYREYHAVKLTVNDLIEGKNHDGIIVDLDSTGMVVAVSPDGQYIATGLWNGEILLSNGEYEELARLEGPVGIVQDVAFTTDGTRLASISDDRTIRLWDTTSGREILEIGYEGYYLNDIAFSGDGQKLLVCEKTNALTVHDASPMVESQDEKPVILNGHSGAVISVDYSQSGNRLITSGGGGTVLWDALKGTPISTIKVGGMGTYSGQFNTDANLIADCCMLKGIPTIKVWDTQHPHQERFSEAFVEEKSAVAFSHDSQYLVIGGEDRALHVYDWRSNTKIGELGRQDDWIVKITMSPHGKYLASTGYSGTLKVWDWDATHLDKPQECRWDYNGGCIFRSDFSPDDKHLAVGGYEGTIRILDVESGEEVRSFPNAHGGMVYCLSFSPDGKYLASGGSDKTVRIWEVQTGRMIDVLLGHKGIVLSVAFSPDGKHVASGEMYWEARIWTPRLE